MRLAHLDGRDNHCLVLDRTDETEIDQIRTVIWLSVLQLITFIWRASLRLLGQT